MFTAMCSLLADAQVPVRRAARAGLVRTREGVRRRAHAAPRGRQDPQEAHAHQNPVRRGQRAQVRIMYRFTAIEECTN